MEEAGLLGENKRWPVHVRTDPITDNYAVEARPFARGKFASVRRCRHLVSGVEYAAKYMRKRRRAQDVRHEIMHEARVLRLSSQHPHIVRMHEVYETPSEIVLVLELVSGGELQRVLDDEEAVSEREAARLLRQILDGVAFLHLHKIAHLDIKPQNLLLTKPFPEGEVKLCDFGISRLISKGVEIREIVGTPDYVAPEVLHYEPISLPTDMWSLGVLTYVLLSGHSPFGGETKQETFCNITRGALDFPQDLFAGVSQGATDFIRRLLIREPRDRMTAEECLSHPWLSLGSSPLPGIHLTLTPEGSADDPSPDTPSPKTTRTEELSRKSASDQPHETSPGCIQNIPQKSPLLQRNGTSDSTGAFSKTTRREENSKVFCKTSTDPSHEPNPIVAQDLRHKSPLLQRNNISDCNSVRVFSKTIRTEEDSRTFSKTTRTEEDIRIFSKTTRTEEDSRLFCKSATGPSHEPRPNAHHNTSSPQLNGTSDCSVAAFCKVPSLNESLEPNPSSLAQNGHRKSPLSPRNGTSDCGVGAFCKSPLLQRDATFSKNNSSGVDQGSGVLRKNSLPQRNGETKESKGRSVDMVVSQFEGMSKRIVFSEEIIVDERVGMVY